MPGIKRRQRIGIVDVNEDEDKPEIIFCQNCEEAGAVSKMGARIYLPDEQGQVIIPKDADEWLQCPACGVIIPRYEGRGEGEVIIDPQFELVENRFDFGKTMIESVRDARRVDRTDLQLVSKKRLRKKKLEEVRDQDIKKEMLEGGKIVSYEITKI